MGFVFLFGVPGILKISCQLDRHPIVASVGRYPDDINVID